MKLLSFLHALLCIVHLPINSHGFDQYTYVHLACNTILSINQVARLALDEKVDVVTYDVQTSSVTIAPAIKCGRSNTSCFIRFCFEGSSLSKISSEKIICTPLQEFYIPAEQRWIPAYQLQIGDELFCSSGTKKIADWEYVEDNLEVYMIEVEGTHTFFVGCYGVLTHNMVLPAALGLGFSVPFGAAAGGTAGSFFGPITIAVGAALGTAIGTAATIVWNDAVPEYKINIGKNQHIDNFVKQQNSNDNNDAQAPGQPTENDGFVPPKNWDGKKVKNPNGSGAGWPDKKGNVWVPTGVGSKAHGGPHWDVQNPKTGGHRNILPGGRER